MDDDTEWWMARGTLTTEVGINDLVTLNMGLRHLFKELDEANREYAAGRQLDGAYLSLTAIIAFISLFKFSGANGLFIPLSSLESALWALDEGIVEPILKPATRKSGRARGSVPRQELKGVAVYVARRLCDFGFSQSEAFETVADELKRIGVKPERGSSDIKSRTVRDWYEKINADIGHHEIATIRYFALHKHPINMALDNVSHENARKILLSRLTAFAAAIGQNPANPPF